MTAIAAPSLIAEPLWTRTRASFARAIAAVGAPVVIAAIQLLTRKLRHVIIERLCPLENIVRKLLLAEAAELRRAALAQAGRSPGVSVVELLQPPPASAQSAASSARAASRPDLSHPETWRVRFSFAAPRDRRRVPDSCAPRMRSLWGPSPPPPAPEPESRPRHRNNEDSPFRLARRFEALRRVLDNPLPHAERLARVLARAVRRFPEIVRRFVMAPARSNGWDRDDPRLAVDAIGAGFNGCFTEPAPFPDSS